MSVKVVHDFTPAHSQNLFYLAIFLVFESIGHYQLGTMKGILFLVQLLLSVIGWDVDKHFTD